MNLLTDSLIPVTTRDGPRQIDLPGLLSGLGDDSIQRIDGLQRHQHDAFYVFLCYLAGAVLARDGNWNPVRPADFWREGLRRLAGDTGDAAWQLVNPDPSRPAFMQPPLPAGDVKRLKELAITPDALDLLPTAKNHDVKQARAARARPHEWLYALVSLQTMSGYFGRGNPGISRMNGGFGNRPIIEVARSRDIAPRWRDAVTRLARHRQLLLEGEWGYRDTGLVLTWLAPWDGDTPLPLNELNPFYLEICRRVRLAGNEEDINSALGVPSNGMRILARDLKGLVGDAWLPIDRSDERNIKALTVSPKGLTADLLRRILFGDGIERTLLQQADEAGSDNLWLLASVLVRGQGTTDGYHQREIPIPAQVRKRLFGPEPDADPLAERAREAISLAGKLQNNVLKPAVFVFMVDDPNPKHERKTVITWWRRIAERFDASWSDAYFPWLWESAEQTSDEALLAWMQNLAALGERILIEAERLLPQHRGRLWRSRVAAQRMFSGTLRKHFPDLKEPRNEQHIA